MSSSHGVYSLVREPTTKNKQVITHCDDGCGRDVGGVSFGQKGEVISDFQMQEEKEPGMSIWG